MCDWLRDRGLTSGENRYIIPVAILHSLPCSAHSKLTRALSLSQEVGAARAGTFICWGQLHCSIPNTEPRADTP